MKKKYLVWTADMNGRDDCDGVFENKEEARKMFEDHKKDKDHYCRLEEVDIKGYDEGNECDIFGDNDTIDSYYPEDDPESEFYEEENDPNI